MGNQRYAASIAVGALAAVLILSPLPASAQFGFSSDFELSGSVQVSEPDGAARAHLERIKALLADKQWDEAVETLRQLMETQGDRMLPAAPGRYVTVREFYHQQITQLPAPALQLYRDRVDPLARQWYEEGLQQRNPAILARVVDQFFASRWGDQALLALGDLALERGEFGAARDNWERISPLLRRHDGRSLWSGLRTLTNFDERWPQVQSEFVRRETPPLWTAYLDTDLDIADVRARLVLVSILEGSLPRAKMELEVFRRLHPDATGVWGGRDINYAAELTRLLEAARGWPAPPPAQDWPTFAGSFARTTAAPPAVRLTGLAWEAPISLGEPQTADASLAQNFGYGGRRPAEDADRLLPYHPLVVGDLLLVNNLSRINAYNLRTGKPAWGQEEGVIFQDEQPAFSTQRHSRSRLGVPRFTMSAADGRLFARMGEPVTSWPPDPPQALQEGYLVCLDLNAQGQLLWKITAGGDDEGDATWAFEGSPVCDAGNIYIAVRRSDVRPQAYVACYDARTGRRLWRQFVCAAETPARGQVDEITSNLLTLAEGTIYYNTNLGAVAALSAASGQVRWISLYARAAKGDLSQPANHFYRDLTPCIYHRGKVIVAPSDSRFITAFDAATGQLLWASDLPTDAIHLLGVSGEQLIASGNRLWWLNVESGAVARLWPESSRSGPIGYGRGMLAGGAVHWPTRDKIYVLDARTTEQIQEPIQLDNFNAVGGNLLAVRHLFLIATPDQIFAFNQVPRPQPAEREVTQGQGFKLQAASYEQSLLPAAP